MDNLELDWRFQMKKKITLLLTGLLVVSLFAGCGAKEEQEAESKNETGTKVEIEAGKEGALVTLGNYKGLPVTAPAVAVNQEEADNLVRQIYYEYEDGEAEGIKNRAVKNGDMVNIDYEGKKDGVAFAGGTAANQQLVIGSNSFIAGFESGLIGVNPGETVDLNLTFPDQYHNKELEGQPVVFTVKVNYIYSTEYKDDAVAGWGEEDYKNVAELKKFVEDYMLEMSQSNYDYIVENSVLSQFLGGCTFAELPEDVITKYSNNLKKSIENQASSFGIDAESFCQYQYGMIMSQFLEIYGVEFAKQRIALQALADAENLYKSEEELDTAISDAAKENGYESVEEFMGNNTREEYREMFMVQDAVQFLIDNAEVTVQ